MAIMVALLIVIYHIYQKSVNENRVVISKHAVFSICIFVCVVLVVGSFGFIPVIQTALSPGGLSQAYSLDTINNNIGWSADLVSFFVPNYIFYNTAANGSISNLFYGSNDRTVYIGYVVIALSLYGIWKTKSKYKFWIAIFVLFWLLSLGPYLKVNNNVTSIPGIYLLYHAIPVINGIREPARFYLVALLAASLLASVGVKELLEKLSNTKKDTVYVYSVVSIICIIFIVESFGIPIPGNQNITLTPYAPHILRQLPKVVANQSFLVLPSPYIPTYIYGGVADYYTTVMQMPLVGGYISRTTYLNVLSEYDIPYVQDATYLATYDNRSFYTPPYSSPINENYSLISLNTLRDYNVSYIIIENNAYSYHNLALLDNFSQSLFGSPIYIGRNITIFSTYRSKYQNIKNNFISYYRPGHWAPYSIPNTNISGWTPINEFGLIITYAPLSIQKGNDSYLNTTMTFIATSFINQSIQVAVCACSVNSNVAHLNMPIYSGIHKYAVNMHLIKGNWNVVEFFDTYLSTNNTNMLILFNNITFNSST